MNASLVFDSLLVWSAQACVVVVLGAVAALALPHPKARLLFWQGLLLLLLALPAIEPWRQPAPVAAPASVSDNTPVPAGRAVAVSRGHSWSREDLLVVIEKT